MPWKESGEHILVCTQSKCFNIDGLGHHELKQPAYWDSRVLLDIRKQTNRKIVYRQHPNGHNTSDSTLSEYIDNFSVSRPAKRETPEKDLADAWATVVYGSNAATDSLLAGVPVFVTGKCVYLQKACNIHLDRIENPILFDNRQELFNRMAWAQFNIKEIENGFAFSHLLFK
jgi:hypothetical protein